VSSPEKVDSRADIYSLGVCFYEMLTGEKPSGPIQLPSRKVQVDVRIDDIVLRALERTPEMRYQTAAEFRTAVETVASSAFPTRKEDQRAGAGETPPDRSWMRIVGLLLLIPGIPLALFGTAAVWLFARKQGGSPGVIAALVTMGSIATAALLLGGSVVLLRLSRGKKSQHSHVHSAEPPPLKPWQQSWLAEPLRRRQTVFWTLLFLTLGLFTVFAWPSYHVTEAAGAQIAVSGFGFPEPWLKEIRTYGAAGQQNWPEYHVANLSFPAGLIGLVCWILLASLQATEMRAQPASQRNSWGNIILTLLLCLGALAHSGLLSCAIIPAPPFMTVALAVALGAPALLRVAFAKASSATPAAVPAEVPQESASHSVVFRHRHIHPRCGGTIPDRYWLSFPRQANLSPVPCSALNCGSRGSAASDLWKSGRITACGTSRRTAKAFTSTLREARCTSHFIIAEVSILPLANAHGATTGQNVAD
jgi:hypothetical protein